MAPAINATSGEATGANPNWRIIGAVHAGSLPAPPVYHAEKGRQPRHKLHTVAGLSPSTCITYRGIEYILIYIYMDNSLKLSTKVSHGNQR